MYLKSMCKRYIIFALLILKWSVFNAFFFMKFEKSLVELGLKVNARQIIVISLWTFTFSVFYKHLTSFEVLTIRGKCYFSGPQQAQIFFQLYANRDLKVWKSLDPGPKAGKSSFSLPLSWFIGGIKSCEWSRWSNSNQKHKCT